MAIPTIKTTSTFRIFLIIALPILAIVVVFYALSSAPYSEGDSTQITVSKENPSVGTSSTDSALLPLPAVASVKTPETTAVIPLPRPEDVVSTNPSTVTPATNVTLSAPLPKTSVPNTVFSTSSTLKPPHAFTPEEQQALLEQLKKGMN